MKKVISICVGWLVASFNLQKRIWLTVCIFMLILIVTPLAEPAINYNDGGIHIISSPLDQGVRVDIDTVNIPGTSVTLVDGGRVRWELIAYNYASVTISGGSVEWDVRLNDYSTLNMSGGTIGDFIMVTASASATISGGEIDSDLALHGYSTTLVSGGIIKKDLHTHNYAELTVSGGSIGSNIFAGYYAPTFDEAHITFVGSNFFVNGIPVAYGDSARDYAVPGTYEGISCLTGNLSGILLNGTPLNNTFYIFEGSDITFAIPEPSFFSLILMLFFLLYNSGNPF